jgi:putative nucleotidyltransferase with HDIG domain
VNADRPSPFGDRPLAWRLTALGAVTLVFTLLIYPSLFSPRHRYALGDVAERDVKATRDFLVEDQAATEIKRREAVQEILTVYDEDPELGWRLARVVDEAFADMRAARKAAAPPDSPAAAAAQAEEARKAFEDKLGIRVNKGAFALLEAEGYSKRIADAIGEILQRISENGVLSARETLLKDFERGAVLRDVRTREERVVRDFKQFQSVEQARSLVRSTGQAALREFDYGLSNLSVDFAQRLIQPNITLNRSETELRKQRAAAEVKPVLYRMKRGEMLVREGERVSELHLLKLKAMESETRPERFFLGILGAAGLMLALFATVYVLHLRRIPLQSDRPAKAVILLVSVFAVFLVLAQVLELFAQAVIRSSAFAIPETAGVFLFPLAAAPMIVCVFLGPPAALPFALVTAVAAAVIFHGGVDLFVFFLVTGSLGAHWVRHCRERKVFATAGAKTGVVGMGLAAAVAVHAGDPAWAGVLWSSAFAFLGGVGAGVVTAGLVPLVEIGLGYTSDITLLELANLDRPLLRRLMLEAPGTYHHSVIVGSMAEAAAAEIEANSLLAKATGYYHDIGKIRKPQYFIENQRNGRNKHDKLAPSMSTLILTAHLKDGVEIAREHRLAPVIVDGIRSHHGTGLIRFFYDKARQLKGDEAVNPEDYRYPGPKPRSREAALVMLADVVEAASRTLDNPTPARIKGLVKTLLDRVFSDGQLDECDLTLKDLNTISRSFNAILNGIHHHRIEYADQRPAAGENGNGKSKDGHPDRQPTKAPPGTAEPLEAGGPDPDRRAESA